MNGLIHRIMGATLGLIVLGGITLNASEAPGYVDFGQLTPAASGGEFVEVNIPANLISMVSQLAGQDEPEIGELLGGLTRVRVNVVALDDNNRAQIQDRLAGIREKLTAQEWTKIVTVRNDHDNVDVFLKTKGEEAVEGIVVTVTEGDKKVVLVNIVGNIRPEQVALVGDRLNIEPLKQAGAVLKKS